MKENFYCSDNLHNEYCKFNRNFIKAKQKIGNGIRCSEVLNGMVIPCDFGNSTIFNPPYSGGVYDDGNFEELSSTYRFYNGRENFRVVGGVSESSFDFDNADYVDDEVVFVGCISANFFTYGDYILDALSRLWIFMKPGNENLKACYISDGREEHYLELFYLFGLKKENLIRIERPCRFNKVIVPESSFLVDNLYHNEYKDIINKIKERVKADDSCRKIYLSRSKLNYNATYGEKIIEDQFRKNGYKVIYPEKLSLREQIAVISGADSIVGVTGSAMHNIVFAKDGVKCCFLNRTEDVHINQWIINDLKHVDATYVDVYVDLLPTNFFGNPFLIGCTEYLMKYFADNHFKYDRLKVYEHYNDNMLPYFFAYAKNYLDNNNLNSEHLDMEKFAKNMMEVKVMSQKFYLYKKLRSYKIKLFFYRYVLFASKKCKKISDNINKINLSLQ